MGRYLQGNLWSSLPASINISILSRKYRSNFLDLEILGFYCHRKLNLSTSLE